MILIKHGIDCVTSAIILDSLYVKCAFSFSKKVEKTSFFFLIVFIGLLIVKPMDQYNSNHTSAISTCMW